MITSHLTFSSFLTISVTVIRITADRTHSVETSASEAEGSGNNSFCLWNTIKLLLHFFGTRLVAAHISSLLTLTIISVRLRGYSGVHADCCTHMITACWRWYGLDLISPNICTDTLKDDTSVFVSTITLKLLDRFPQNLDVGWVSAENRAKKLLLQILSSTLHNAAFDIFFNFSEYNNAQSLR